MKYLPNLVFLALIIIPISADTLAQQTGEHRTDLFKGEFFGIDRSHSNLKFSVGFFGLTDVEGTFDQYDATILYNEADMAKTAVILRIDAASIDTGSDFRDKDLTSERFLHTEQYPEIVFKSTSIKPAGDGYTLLGDLTIKGITKQISIPFKHVLKRTVDPGWGNIRIGFAGTVTINRNDFNVHGGDFWGVNVLSEEVDISFTLLGTNHNLDKIAYRSQNKPSIGEEMEKVYTNGNVQQAIEMYQKLKQEGRPDYNFSERELNLFVNKLFQRNQLQDALKAAIFYKDEFSDSPFAWTTLGEIQAKLGHKVKARQSFTKAIDLDAANDMAQLALNRINGNP